MDYSRIIAAVVLAVGLVGAASVVDFQPDNVTVGGNVGVPGVNLVPTTGLENTVQLPIDVANNTLIPNQSGSIIYSSASSSTTTLPAAREGLWYKFQVNQAIQTGNWIIDSAEGDNIEGTLIVAGAVVDCAAEDQINFVTDGENLGDYVVVRSDGTNWLIEDSGVLTTAKMTCTDPN